jgi:acylphosphatase
MWLSGDFGGLRDGTAILPRYNQLMPGETQKRLQARVEGRVQGVGYRYFVQRAAVRHRITGWVRNRWDGSVEMVAEGDEPGLNQLLAEIRNGPPGSTVTSIDSSWGDFTGEFTSFRIRSTG